MLVMPLPGKEAVVTLCHPSNEKWKSEDRAWAYPVAKGELTKVFDKNGFFDKQSIINRDMVDDMYRKKCKLLATKLLAQL